MDLRPGAFIEEPVAALGQHRRIDIRMQHEPVGADLASHPGAQITRAAGKIQRRVTGAQSRAGQRKCLPYPMCAKGHQVIHQVVIFGHRIEYSANSPGLGSRGHGLVAEMGGVFVAGHGAVVVVIHGQTV